MGAPWRATLLFLSVGVLVVIGTGALLLDAEQRAFQSHVDTVALQAAHRLSSFMHARELLVESVARERAAGLLPDAESFTQRAEILHGDLPGFRALNWVDPDGVIRIVTPAESNRAALGRDIDDHPQAARWLERARRTRATTATDPVNLFQGEKGFATYFPVVVDGDLMGFLNAVFTFDELIDAALREGVLDDYEAHVVQGEGAVFTTPGWSDAPRPRGRAEAPAFGRVWRIDIAPKPEVLATLRWGRPEAELFGGALLWLGMAALLFRLLRRREEQAQLEKERRELAGLVEASPDPHLIISGEIVRYSNAAADSLLGPVQGKPIGELFDEGAWARVATTIADAGSYAGESRAKTAAGAVDVRVAASRLGGTDVALSLADLREARRMQTALAHAQKLEALGRLAGSVAHDFNNLLAAIVAFVTILRVRRDLADGVAETLDQITDAAMRGAELTRSLLTFTRKEQVVPQHLELSAEIRGMREPLRQLVRKDIELVLDLAPDLPRVVFDRVQLEQVLLNLVVNAVHAMPEGGRLEISTIADGDDVVLRVRDDGIGMSDEVRESAFEPFFTTKQPGVGTGLGLSSVRSCVVAHGGRVSLESAEGEGTTLRITLPGSKSDDAPRPEVSPPSERRLDARVLLVDDDDAVRESMQGVLSAAGLQCTAAASGQEALRRFEPGDFDVVLLDMVMPGMGGAALARAIREQSDIPIVILTGYAGHEDTSVGDAVLTKPVRPSELLDTLGAVLAEKREPSM